jgi:hypothetical protein
MSTPYSHDDDEEEKRARPALLAALEALGPPPEHDDLSDNVPQLVLKAIAAAESVDESRGVGLIVATAFWIWLEGIPADSVSPHSQHGHRLLAFARSISAVSEFSEIAFRVNCGLDSEDLFPGLGFGKHAKFLIAAIDNVYEKK